ncbi:MAG: dTDP-4-dehydrorhamnose reductase [Pseudomonadota bacterium]
MKPVLITGATGQLGWELRRALAAGGEVLAFEREQMDFLKPESIRDLMTEWKPALVVNPAAYTAVDAAETAQETARAVNAIAPGVLAEECKRVGAALIHYSTDYVFDGTKAGAYTEVDQTNPLGAYGRSKLEGERFVAASGAAHLIFRTEWIYAGRGKNFLLTMRRLSKERDELRVVDDQVGTPTWARMLAEATAAVVAQSGILRNGDAGWIRERSGVYHLTCAGQTSWCGFARAIVERVPGARKVPVTPITTADYPTPARRPVNSVLDCNKAYETFGVRLPPWEEALALCAEDMAATGG